VRIDDDVKLDYADVLIRPKRSTLVSRREVDLEREFTFRHAPLSYKGVPVMAANMDTVGTFEMAMALYKQNMFTCVHKHYSLEEWKSPPVLNTVDYDYLHNCAVSTGTSSQDIEKIDAVLRLWPNHLNYICIDVANGYTETFIDAVKYLRDKYPTKVIIAGNVVTADMTEALILAGADIVKVGIGPGSVCTTRKKAGVGYPQLSAVIECADAAHGLGGHIIADGGCTCPGDIAKAFGGGADFVMLGGMLAGHDESGGYPFTDKDGQQFVEFYGMSSREAQMRHSGELAAYRASEGKHVFVPYRGPVAQTLQDILGGVRSACTYVGARKLKELSRRTTFVRVSRQTNESLTKYEGQD
jgi:GMP reductase